MPKKTELKFEVQWESKEPDYRTNEITEVHRSKGFETFNEGVVFCNEKAAEESVLNIRIIEVLLEVRSSLSKS